MPPELNSEAVPVPARIPAEMPHSFNPMLPLGKVLLKVSTLRFVGRANQFSPEVTTRR